MTKKQQINRDTKSLQIAFRNSNYLDWLQKQLLYQKKLYDKNRETTNIYEKKEAVVFLLYFEDFTKKLTRMYEAAKYMLPLTQLKLLKIF